MIGAGLFINPAPLTAAAGPLGVLSYVFSFFLLLPVLFSLAHLAEKNPVSGGLYVYSKLYLSPFAGFISGWGYFLGKTTSAALLMHSFTLFLQRSLPAFAAWPAYFIDCCAIFALSALHIAGARIGGRAQLFFSCLKLIPLGMGILFSFLAFTPAHFYYAVQDVFGATQAIPLALFASFGFEIICSIGHLVQEPETYIKPVIVTTFFVVICFNMLFQVALFGALGSSLADTSAPLLLLAQHTQGVGSWLLTIGNSFVFAAIIGSCFSVFTSNVWNLHTLSVHGHLPGARYVNLLTVSRVPWVALLVQGAIACTILWLTVSQVSLQSMAVFGQIVAHFFTAWAAWRAVKLGALPGLKSWVPLLSIIHCVGILILCLYRILAAGVCLSYLIIFFLGIASYFMTKNADLLNE